MEISSVIGIRSVTTAVPLLAGKLRRRTAARSDASMDATTEAPLPAPVLPTAAADQVRSTPGAERPPGETGS